MAPKSAEVEKEKLFRLLLDSDLSALTPKQKLSIVSILFKGATLDTLLRAKNLIEDSIESLSLQRTQEPEINSEVEKFHIEIRPQRNKHYLYIRRYLSGLTRHSESKYLFVTPFLPGKKYVTEDNQVFRFIRFRPTAITWDHLTCMVDLQFFPPNEPPQFKSLSFPECLEIDFRGAVFHEVVETPSGETAEFPLTKNQIRRCASNMQALASLSEIIVGQVWETRNFKRERSFILSFQGQDVAKIDRSQDRLVIMTNLEQLVEDIKNLCSAVLSSKQDAIHFTALASEFFIRIENPTKQDIKKVVFSLFAL